MKTYEKPKLIALSISGNDMLCSTCAVDIIGDNMDDDFRSTYGDFISDPSQAFGEEDQACADKPWKVSGYCKFTGSNVVINS